MIDEKKLIDEIEEYIEEYSDVDENGYHNLKWCAMMEALEVIKQQPKIGEWIPVSEGLPKERDWYLAVFRESDTGFILIPRVAEYVGRETKITTKDYWIIIDLSTPVEYIRNLECIAWQPKPEPWKGE